MRGANIGVKILYRKEFFEVFCYLSSSITNILPKVPFQTTLLYWYQRNKRDLPWRNSDDPYHIWLSEVILQQTRVDQGLPYYERFVKRYPRVQDLATAELDSILKEWEGLGYYSRARNLYHAANQVISDFDGRFPSTYPDLLKLKGVGDYTAAAVSSIVFGEAQAVVDGNVYRVLARYFGISEPVNTGSGQRIFRDKAQSLLPDKDPGTYNQALMEFGALQCIPRSPNCQVCPLRDTCRAYQADSVEQLPVKQRKKYDRKRYLQYFLMQHGDEVYIERRPEGDIWAGLYQFLLFESGENQSYDLVLEKARSIHEAIEVIRHQQLKPHKLSHQSLHIGLMELKVQEKPPGLAGQWVSREELKTYAFPRPLRAFLDRNELTLRLD